MSRSIILSLLIFISAFMLIRAEYGGPQSQVYFFKPLTTCLVILLAWQFTRPVSAGYQVAILVGLIFSLAGDIFLMLPTDRFIAGLLSFLIAHLCYIAAFTSGKGFQFSIPWLIPCLFIGGVMLALLWPHLGRLKIPVLIYMIVILVMLWQALGQLGRGVQLSSFLAAVGAILFVVSDSSLALNRFREPFAAGRALVLSTYYLAQWLIALSVAKQGF